MLEARDEVIFFSTHLHARDEAIFSSTFTPYIRCFAAGSLGGKTAGEAQPHSLDSYGKAVAVS
jgi:hypothetical protein